MDIQDEADDLLASMGLNTSIEPADSNEAFYAELAYGKYSKIDNAVYWMRCEFSIWLFTQEQHIKTTKSTVQSGKATDRPVTRLEMARVLLQYYLQMQHEPRFRKINERTPCDYTIMIDKIVAYPAMKEMIENYQG